MKIIFTGYYEFNNYLFGLAYVNSLRQLGGNYVPTRLSPPVSGIDGKYLVPKMLGSFHKCSEGFYVSIKRCHLSVFDNVSLDLKFRQNYFLKNRIKKRRDWYYLWHSFMEGCFSVPVIHKVVKKIRRFIMYIFSQS